MPTRELTPLLTLSDATVVPSRLLSERLLQLVFGAIQWPWLLRSLYGGTRASKAELLARLGLATDALPHLGSWKADTYLLHRLVDLVEELKPRTVVELGSGVTTLVLAKALQRVQPEARLISYDQHAEFMVTMSDWLAENGVSAEIRHAPLSVRSNAWPGPWYQLDNPPAEIDMLLIDGPPWTVHPLVRGAADVLFPRLAENAVVVLDDAARPGERLIARRWKRKWAGIEFRLESGGSKGTLIGRKIS